MDVNRARENQYGIGLLEDYNRRMEQPRPLDATNTLGSNKKPLVLR